MTHTSNNADDVGRLVKNLCETLDRSKLMYLRRFPGSATSALRPDQGANPRQTASFQAYWIDGNGQRHVGHTSVTTNESGLKELVFDADTASRIEPIAILSLAIPRASFQSLETQVTIPGSNAAKHSDRDPDAFVQSTRNDSRQLDFTLSGATHSDEQSAVEIDARFKLSPNDQGVNQLRITISNSDDEFPQDTLRAVVEITGVWDEESLRNTVPRTTTRTFPVLFVKNRKEDFVLSKPLQIGRVASVDGTLHVVLRPFLPSDIIHLSGDTDEADTDEELSEVSEFLAFERPLRCRMVDRPHEIFDNSMPGETLAVRFSERRTTNKKPTASASKEARSEDPVPFQNPETVKELRSFIVEGGIHDHETASQLVEALILFRDQQLPRRIHPLVRRRSYTDDIMSKWMIKMVLAFRDRDYDWAHPGKMMTTFLKRIQHDLYRRITGCQRKHRRHEIPSGVMTDDDSVPYDRVSADDDQTSVPESLHNEIGDWMASAVAQLSPIEQSYVELTNPVQTGEVPLVGLKGQKLCEALDRTESQVETIRNNVRFKLAVCGALDRLQGHGDIVFHSRRINLPEPPIENALRLKYVRDLNWPDVEQQFGWTEDQRRELLKVPETLLATQIGLIWLLVNRSVSATEIDLLEDWLLYKIADVDLCQRYAMDSTELNRRKRELAERLDGLMETIRNKNALYRRYVPVVPSLR